MDEATAAVGQRIRSAREQQGWSQDQLAARLREHGLTWDRSMLTKVEAGGRVVRLDELVLLATTLLVPLPQLTGSTKFVTLVGGASIATDALIRLLQGDDPSTMGPADLRSGRPVKLSDRPAKQRQALHAVPGTAPAWAGDVFGRSPVPDVILELATAQSKRDVERKAARRLGVPPLMVALASWRLWNRGLVDHRDLRVDEMLSDVEADPDGESKRIRRARARQAIRGHVTRDLLSQIEPIVAPYREDDQ